jgi:acid phosphatase
MTRRLLPLLAAALLAPAAALAASPPKPPAPKDVVLRYYDSGDWARDVKTQLRTARHDLRHGLRHPDGKRRPAIVLDIDDTSLTQFECRRAHDDDFSGGVAGAECVASGTLPAIRPTRALFRLAQRKHVRVFFVTGRPEGARAVTVRNLRRAGYRGRYELLLRPNGDLSAPSVVPFKVGARRSIEGRGFEILVNVGDQRSDLQGGAADRRVRVPNPMYFIP